jgi:hypothetical protein
MANVEVHKRPSAETSNTSQRGWDPFWFMREMLHWTPFRYSPTFDVKETDDAYVYTLVVPKTAAAVTRPPAAPPPERTRRTTETDRGSAARTLRRGARSPSRRG